MATSNNKSGISINKYSSESDNDSDSPSFEAKLRTTSTRPKIRAGKNK